MNNVLADKIKNLPTDSGVYIMKDINDEILYVGKAKNLRNRVRQYFQDSVNKSEKTYLLVEKIENLDYILTKTEVDALVLENNLIKAHKPFYNILLKDDKAYPYIKINVKDAYPKIEITRKLKKDGSRYFGPYMIDIPLKDILSVIHTAFPLRTCNRVNRKAKRECLNYHLGKCLAPCTGRINSVEYNELIKKVIDFLNGNEKEVEERIRQKIEFHAENMEFEIAKDYRDILLILQKIGRKQIINLPKTVDIDIFSLASNGNQGVINFMVIRKGKLLGSKNLMVPVDGFTLDVLSTFIVDHYQKNPILAKEIYLYNDVDFKEELETVVNANSEHKVKIYHPKIGIKKEMTEMSYKNASHYLEKQSVIIESEEAKTTGAVTQLQELLNLKKLPKRMECYDISNISGTDKVSSMVVFINGSSANKMYRHFKIKTVKGADDFKSMRETLSRRLSELSSDDVSFSDTPDLIVIDGGKGQLSSVADIIDPYGIEVISLAKREEEVFKPNNSQSILLPRNSYALKLLQSIRDEAHRFAITFHRKLREQRQTKSMIKEIEGIGDKKARALLLHFKSVEKIRVASKNEIMEVDGIGEDLAEKIKEYFQQGAKDEI